MIECVRHRDWEILPAREEEGGEVYLYAKCNQCGETKSALVDFTRDYANCGPVHEDEYERELGR